MRPIELAALLAKPSKYRAKRITVDGEKFDSVAEANRYFALRTLEKNGAITNLRRQVRFDLVIGSFKRAYVADYVYDEHGAEIVEDCKGFATEVYKIKRDLMLALHGIKIRETGKGRGR